MGKRGSSSGFSKGAGPNGAEPEKERDEMAVPYDEWGPMIDETLRRVGDDGITEVYGSIRDDTVYNMERDYHTTTKKELLADIEAWRMDDGSYGDDDTHIYIAYEDGSTWSSTDDHGGKPFKKRGIIGMSLSTGDYEEVWGEDWVGRGWERRRTPMKTSEDPETGEPGRSNTYAGYKPVSKYKIRTRVTYEPDARGRMRPKRERLRQSTTVPV